MLREAFWWLIATVALWTMFWLTKRCIDHQDAELGRQACRDDIPLNPRWTRAMQDGWADEFLLRTMEKTR